MVCCFLTDCNHAHHFDVHSLKETALLKGCLVNNHSLALRNFDHVVQLVLNTVAMRYTTAILQKRITLKTQEDRKLVAERIMSVSTDEFIQMYTVL